MNLHTLSSYLQVFSIFKLPHLLFNTIRPENKAFKPHITEISYLPKVKLTLKRFLLIHLPRKKMPILNSQMKNKSFAVDDNVGTSTIADLSVLSEDDEEEVKSNNVWEHVIDTLFKFSLLHPERKRFRKWVKHQTMDDMEQFYLWDENYLSIGELSSSYFESSWDKGNPGFLKNNPIKNLYMLWK